MEIRNPCVVSLVWRLEDALGVLIDELPQPMEFLVGGDDLLAKVEAALIGQEAGFEAALHLEPADAFGDYRSELVCFESKEIFHDSVEEGMQFDGLPPGAQSTDMPNDVIYTITEVYDTHVVLDGNHPLAGLALNLSLKVADVREATAEEIENGSVADSIFSLAPDDESQERPPGTLVH
jgi:FKBP-type peptidyl-prolyl cis-trans isomerase SlyD